MTTIYLAGAENPTHQEILASCGATHVAVNVGSLLRRKAAWELDLPGEWEWVAWTDSPVSLEDLQAILSEAPKPPVSLCGPPEWSEVDNYLPLWNGTGEVPTGGPGLVVTDKVFKGKDSLRKALSTRRPGKVFGAVTGSSDKNLRKFDFIVSGAWWSVMKYGETQVWDGQKLNRYNADFQSEVFPKHMTDVERLGSDVSLVSQRDPDELARLAVTSWMHYSEALSNAEVLPFVKSEVANETDTDLQIVGFGSGNVASDTTKERHERDLLPVVGMGAVASTYRLGDGTEVSESQSVLQSKAASIRKCDNCHLAVAGCPGFEPGAYCKYEIPVEIKTKEQLTSVMQSVVEIQTQRVLQARFAEEVVGQELSGETGREMDRLFRLVEKMKDVQDNRDTLKLSVEAKANSGVLSRLFGSNVGSNARQLASPIDPNDVIDAVEVFDPTV